MRLPQPMPAQDGTDLRAGAAASRGSGAGPLHPLPHPDRGAAPAAGTPGREGSGMRITAAVLPDTGQPIEVRDVELAAPGRDEVLVRIHASGVCHSDLNAVDGTSATRCPAVLGHEGAGVVEAGWPRGGLEVGEARRAFLETAVVA